MKSLALPLILLAASLSLPSCVMTIGDTVASQRAVAPSSAGTLVVRFEGIENPSGQILLSLFDNQAAHDGNGTPARVAAIPIDGQTALARFEGLAPGPYAIKAFHDIDGDGNMRTNPFGLPLEPFAFSNNARAEGGPARWDATRFAVVTGDNRVSIRIK